MFKKIFAILLVLGLILPGPDLFGQIEENLMETDKPSTISLDFKGMDIVDVLKLLAQRGNMNISISKNVRGKVTLFLKEVDIRDAFEIILASNNLAYETQGGIINVMTEKDYEKLYGTNFSDKKEIRIFQLKYAKASTVNKALEQIKTKIGKIVTDESSNTLVVIDTPHAVSIAQKIIREADIPTETRIFGLDYAKAEDIKTKIEERLTENVGMVQVDERTNKIIVTDLSHKMAELERVIAELDERTSQVLIEAKIIQVTLNDEFRTGVNWDYIFHEGYNISTGLNLRNLSTAAAAGVSDVLPAATGVITGSAFKIGDMDEHDYQYIIELLKTMGKTEILSAPRIVVINNEEASILVGSSRPYATTGTTIGETLSETTQQVTYVDLGVKLHVTPTINRDGFVTMKIKPEVSSRTGDIQVTSTTTPAGGQAVTDTTNIPIIQTSTAETTVMVKDGNTIVLAGLIEDRKEKSEDKVPFLGDIPLVGEAFKRRTIGSADEPEKTELIIFLTPYIITGEAIAPEVNEYLTTREIGKSEIKEEVKKKESTRFVLFDKKSNKKSTKRRSIKKAKTKTTRITSATYYDIVRNKVYQKARLNYPRSSIEGTVYVAFSLLSNGHLNGSPKVLGNADETLKALAIKSVYDAVPFPPFPSDLDKKQQAFKILISYK